MASKLKAFRYMWLGCYYASLENVPQNKGPTAKMCIVSKFTQVCNLKSPQTVRWRNEHVTVMLCCVLFSNNCKSEAPN